MLKVRERRYTAEGEMKRKNQRRLEKRKSQCTRQRKISR
jgi:hypothetical protein